MIVRRLICATAAAASILVAAAGAVAGYGPEGPPGPAVPGGFSLVVATRTIAPSGGTLAVTISHAALRLRVPAHAVARPVQFTFTRPRVGALRTSIPEGKRLLVGFALLANTSSGTQIRGVFSRRPVAITISKRTITRKTQVLAWSPARHRFVRSVAVVRPGRIVISMRRFGEFVVVSPR